MYTRSLAAIVLFPIALICSGCAGGSLSLNYYDDDPPPVRVTHVHRHTDDVYVQGCHDCYWDGVRVVVVKGHRHGPGCGHSWSGRQWIVVGKARAEPVHRHHAPRRVTRVRRVP